MKLSIFTAFLLGVNSLGACAADALVNTKYRGIPAFKKVVLILFENEDIDKPLSQPFFTRLAHEGALLNNYHAVAHPSEPNYIALTSGDTQGVTGDGDYDLSVRHLGDLLEEKGKTWKIYAEDYPGDCFLGSRKGKYVRKHTPFLSYTNISQTERCKNVLNANRFYEDARKGTLPDFSFFTPNLDNDVHDTDIAYGEKWFKKTFEPLLTMPAFKDVLLIVTFDENECNTLGPFVSPSRRVKCQGDSNQVYTVFFGKLVKPGFISTAHYDHYSLLKTLEQGFKLSSLGKKDSTAQVIYDIWR